MPTLSFSKWEGTGNDFIVIDDRGSSFPLDDQALVKRLCDRHFGIGSDGLILIRPPQEEGTLYHMEFFNPDASRSFCGNGSRCAFAFWSQETGIEVPAIFTAIDGEHRASWAGGQVMIGMRPVGNVEEVSDHIDLLHTGSPHLVCWVEDPDALDLVTEARKHRYGPRFGKEGINVNYVRWKDGPASAGGRLEMRTYERGVEAETLSCGTGVTASALSAMHRGLTTEGCDVRTKGGDLRVLAAPDGRGGYDGISLIGPVHEVFRGRFQS